MFRNLVLAPPKPLLICWICPCNCVQMMPVSQSHSSSSPSNFPASPIHLFLTSPASQVPCKRILKECHSFDSLCLSLSLLSGFTMFWVCESGLFYNSRLSFIWNTHAQTSSSSYNSWFKYGCKPTTKNQQWPEAWSMGTDLVAWRVQEGFSSSSGAALSSPWAWKPTNNHCPPSTGGRTSTWGLLVWIQSHSSQHQYLPKGWKEQREHNRRSACRAL